MINFNPINVIRKVFDFLHKEYEGLEAFVKDKSL